MEHILRPIYQERASHPDTIGVILINKREDASNMTDTFDAVLLIIVKNGQKEIFSKHYLDGTKKNDDARSDRTTITEMVIYWYES